MIQTEISTSRLRNGNVLKAHIEGVTSHGIIEVPQVYWIRSRSNEPSILDRIIGCEDQRLDVYHFPVLSILEGRYGQIVFEGVFSPRELKLVDPRKLRLALGRPLDGYGLRTVPLTQVNNSANIRK